MSACNAGDLGSIPGSGRSPEEGMAPLSSTPAWKIPWTEEPGGLQSTGSRRVRHDWATSLTYTYLLTLTSLLYKLEYQGRLTLLPKTAKTLDKIYETMDFRRWPTGSAGQSPWVVSLWLSQLPVWRSFLLWCRKRNLGGAWSRELKKQSESLRRQDNQSSQGRVTEERGLPRKKAPQVCLTCAFSWELIRPRVWGTYVRLGKSRPRRSRRHNIQSSHNRVNCLHSY